MQNISQVVQISIILSCMMLYSVQSAYATTQQATEQKASHEGKNFIDILVKLANKTTGETEEIHISVDKRNFKKLKITANEINNTYIVSEPGGRYSVPLRDGRKIPLNMEVEEFINFINLEDSLSYSISKKEFMSRTLDDMKDDPSLRIIELPPLMWTKQIQRRHCTSVKTTVSLTSTTLVVHLGNKTIVKPKQLKESASRWPGYNQGIILTAIDPWTCEETFYQIFHTFDFGYFRDLIWALQTIPPGRLIILASVGSASVHLGSAKLHLSHLGSSWSEFLLHRDVWLTVTYSRGKIISETFLPNLNTIYDSGSPVRIDFDLSQPPSSHDTACYKEWKTEPEWEARKMFCSNNDGFGLLCDCQHPFVLSEITKNSSKENQVESFTIPLVIVAGNRTRYLYRLLESVGNQDGVSRENILIVVDSNWEATRQLAYLLGLQILYHKTEATNSKARIALNLKFGLYQALKTFPKSKYFIVLEDDLIVSPDFYSYMQHLAPIFDMDDSIFSVSAFNHLSYPHTSKDPSQIYRVNTYPAYGWMMSRTNLEYILPKFISDKIKQDWDFFIGSNFVSQNRETLIPDINRSYHWGIGGIHNRGSLTAEEFYLSRNFNQDTNITYMPLESLLQNNYEKDFKSLITQAKTVKLNQDMTNFSSPLVKGGVYKILIRKMNDSDDNEFRYIGEMLGIWYMDARDHHNHAWRLNYMGATLFVIGAPLSPYSILRQAKESYMSSNTKYDVAEHWNEIYSSVAIPTHLEFGKLPEMFYMKPVKTTHKT